MVPAVTTAATFTVATMDLLLQGSGVLVTALQTATATLTLSGCTQFSGGTTTSWTTANGFGQTGTYYYRSASTAHWTALRRPRAADRATCSPWPPRQATSSYVDFLVSEFADTCDYIKIVAGVVGDIHEDPRADLTVQRKPANMRIPSA